MYRSRTSVSACAVSRSASPESLTISGNSGRDLLGILGDQKVAPVRQLESGGGDW